MIVDNSNGQGNSVLNINSGASSGNAAHRPGKLINLTQL
jgi:hypothetical protein